MFCATLYISARTLYVVDLFSKTKQKKKLEENILKISLLYIIQGKKHVIIAPNTNNNIMC